MKNRVRGFVVNDIVKMNKEINDDDGEDVRERISEEIRHKLSLVTQTQETRKKKSHTIEDFVEEGNYVNCGNAKKLLEGMTTEIISGKIGKLKEKINNCNTVQEKVNLIYDEHLEATQKALKDNTMTGRRSYNTDKMDFRGIVRRQGGLRYCGILTDIVEELNDIVEPIEENFEEYELRNEGVKIKKYEMMEYDRIGRTRADKILAKYPVWQLLAKTTVKDLQRLCNEWTWDFRASVEQMIEDAKKKSKRTRVGGRLKKRLQQRSK